ncbi:MAG: LysE family transporter [Syntrophomonadaceae bacterium]|nr:LysE family transporter [Syntrophomonadaceae bacterium]
MGLEIAIIFGTSFLVAFSGAMVPGPLLTFAISEAVRGGFITAPLIMLGHALLELLLVIGLLAGFSVYLQQPAVFSGIAIFGGAFLLYMGFAMVRDAWRGRFSLDFGDGHDALEKNMAVGMDDSPAPGATAAGLNEFGPKEVKAQSKRLNPVAGGFLISLANPFWSLWWVSVGLGYITLSMKNGLPGVASFYTGHILADVTWYFMIAAAVAGGRKFLSDAVYRAILIACGIFLIVLGMYFGYTGLRIR